MIFLTSWDDGHPQDLRVADLLSRHGLSGTFFIPNRNSEGRAVLNASERRQMDKGFEIGSHTLDHTYLINLRFKELEHQIKVGKEALEQELGHSVDGFCYPGGCWNKQIVDCVKDAGFNYARTIENLRIDIPTQNKRFLMPTTLQFYPHNISVILRNFVRHGKYFSRGQVLLKIINAGSWNDRFLCFNKQNPEELVFHVWGHSWEIEEKGLWKELDYFLSVMASLNSKTLTLEEFSNLSLESFL